MGAMAVAGSMASMLSLKSPCGVGASTQGSGFQEFCGLAGFKPFGASLGKSPLPQIAASGPLRIEASEPTRRETIKKRHQRLRKKLNGTSERPRLAVFRSNQHLYAQVIDDTKQHTLAHASTLTKAVKEELEFTAAPTIDAAKKVGEAIAKACLEKGISKVAFDRGGFVYHGRIKALADAAREVGLDF